jgi:hypothetical protein
MTQKVTPDSTAKVTPDSNAKVTPKKQNKTEQNKNRLKINHILVQFLHRDLFFSCLLNLGFETTILLALNF